MARRAADPRQYFTPGCTVELAGMRLVTLPERARRVLPKPVRRLQPHVFVLDPGPLAECADGCGCNIRPGDALWQVAGNVAWYGDFHVDSIASLAAALAHLHGTNEKLVLQFVSASEDPEHDRRAGSILPREIHLTDGESAELAEISRSLRRHARFHGLPWRLPRRPYSSGPYVLHVLQRWLAKKWRRWWTGSRSDLAQDHAAHEQYWWRLVMGLAEHVPCEVIVAAEGDRLVYRPAELDKASERFARQVARQMSPYQVGSARWLFRTARKWIRHARTADAIPVRLGRDDNLFRYRVRFMEPFVAGIAVRRETAAPVSAECPRI